ncbi:MAG: serine/threonine protein kinase [Deltaproteobacteria bacterium]|nr:serine/threonine protein kinase [Deltaproteobacteria bacterium]
MENLGRYEIIRRLGLGGMAEVFLTRSRCIHDTKKLTVLKKIHSKLAKNSRFIEMFIDEARVAMRLNHPNIVQVYSFDHVQGTYALTMEYMDGGNLLTLLRTTQKKETRLSFGLAAYIAAEVAKGLDYVHSRCDDRFSPLEIVHRDVSPQNILLSREGAVKIGDFGIARAKCVDEKTLDWIVGKAAYMSPEQAAGMVVDRRSDIYALGMVLYEMLIGRHPLQLLPNSDGRYKSPPSPRRLNLSIPDPLNEVVRKATSFEPSNRYATARDMAMTLRNYLHSQSEIYDDHTLKSFLDQVGTSEDSAPVSMIPPPIAVQSTKSHSSVNEAGYVTRLDLSQKSTVVILGRLTIAPHPRRLDIEKRLHRLIRDITFKTEGILQHKGLEFSVFLGFAQSAIGSPVQAVRLASDVIDATRALSRDALLNIHIRLAVARGRVTIRRGPQERQWRIYPGPRLKVVSQTLIDVVSPYNILVEEPIYRAAKNEFSFEEQRTDSVWRAFAVKIESPRQLHELQDCAVGQVKHG